MKIKEIRRDGRIGTIKAHQAFAIAMAALILAFGGIVKADLYSLSADWSDTVNPNGVWSYLVGSTAPANSYSRGGDPFNNPPGFQPIWAHSNFTYFGWSKNNGSNSNPWDLAVGDVYGHTQGTLGIQWTSPMAGPTNVTGGVWAIRDIGRSNYWQITLNGSMLANGYVYSGDPHSRSNPASIDLSFIPNVGDVLEFTTRPDNTHGNGVQDYIALDLAVNVVPAPGAVLLGMLGVGVAGLKLRKYV